MRAATAADAAAVRALVAADACDLQRAEFGASSLDNFRKAQVRTTSGFARTGGFSLPFSSFSFA
jgi:hypothetical protein